MNIDPESARDHRLPRLPRRPPRGGARSWCARRAAWPTRSATTSRCCSSTRPASRPEPAGATWRPGSTSPGSTTSGRSAPTTCALRALAESGARVRRESHDAAAATAEAIAATSRASTSPRAVIAAGPDSRLLRAVLEPWCPVPVRGLARSGAARLGGQPRPGRDAGARGLRHGLRVRGRRGRTPRLPGRRRLPADLAGRRARRRSLHHGAADGHRRPARHGRRDARLPRAGRASVPGPTPRASRPRSTTSPMSCSPHRDLAVNPAKMLAIALADTTPIVWGGSVLAARAARRVAESIRRASSGRTALAGDAEHLAAGDRGGPAARRLRRPVRRRRRRPADLRPLLRRPRRRRRRPGGPRAARPAPGRGRAPRRTRRDGHARTRRPRWRATPPWCCRAPTPRSTSASGSSTTEPR